MDLPITRYAVVFLDVLTSQTEILKVFADFKDGLKYMHEVVDSHEEYADTNWYRKIADSSSAISIYCTHWLAAKSLIARYSILTFQEEVSINR